jgi:hypothetical protein
VFYVAKRLEIDYAPAMVGFEFRNGHSHPVFDGIVVCAEFKDAIVEVILYCTSMDGLGPVTCERSVKLLEFLVFCCY